jgi:uncharacterized membrane protein YedE/YeeE
LVGIRPGSLDSPGTHGSSALALGRLLGSALFLGCLLGSALLQEFLECLLDSPSFAFIDILLGTFIEIASQLLKLLARAFVCVAVSGLR